MPIEKVILQNPNTNENLIYKDKFKRNAHIFCDDGGDFDVWILGYDFRAGDCDDVCGDFKLI